MVVSCGNTIKTVEKRSFSVKEGGAAGAEVRGVPPKATKTGEKGAPSNRSFAAIPQSSKLDLNKRRMIFLDSVDRQVAEQDPGPGVDPKLLQQAGVVSYGEKGAGGGDDQAHVREPGGER